MTKRCISFLLAAALCLTSAVAFAQTPVVGGTLPVTGSIIANAGAVTLTIPPGRGYASVGVDVSGTWVGTIVVQCAAALETSSFEAVTLSTRTGTTGITSFTANGQWVGSIAGCQRIRAVATAWTSGTAVVTLVGSFAAGGAGGGGGVSGDTELPAAAVLADATANPTAPAVASYMMAFNGTTWDRVRTSLDPCAGSAKTPIVINISTATTTELTPSLAGAANYYHVCSIVILPTAGAQSIAFVDDDTDGCVSVTSGMAGGTTAASGANISANGGFVAMGAGQAVMRTNGLNRVICAVTSAAVQTSGVMWVVAAP